MNRESILCISDMHHPFCHPDTTDFLKELKTTFKPTKVICLGDEIDFHSISFHTHSPELYSPSHELEKAIESLNPIYKLFPKVDVVESNHSSLVYRKQSFHGLPRAVFKSYREILAAPKGWEWHQDLTFKMNNGLDVFFTHGMKANVTLLSQNMGLCAVQGHFHSKFKIEYWANPNERKWGMQLGCLIHDKSLAFAYNKTTLERPIIGTGLIINGYPRLQLMELDKHHRWTGRLVG